MTMFFLTFLSFVFLNGLALSTAPPKQQPSHFDIYGPIDIRLLSGPTSRGSLCEFEVKNARQALFNIKHRLGSSALHAVVQPEIDYADKFWHRIIKHTKKGKEAQHSIANLTIEALVSPHILNTTSFLLWLQNFAPTGPFPNRLVQGQPQHYSVEFDPPGVIESWDLIPVTHFIQTPMSEEKPFMEAIPLSEFPIQIFSSLNLRDGTLVVDQVLAVGDRLDGKGMQIRFVAYFPGALEEALTEGVREHVAVEMGNWMRFAYEDIVSGRFSVPGPGSVG